MLLFDFDVSLVVLLSEDLLLESNVDVGELVVVEGMVVVMEVVLTMDQDQKQPMREEEEEICYSLLTDKG